MEVVRLADAEPYEAPRHFGISTLRLQGAGTTAAERFTVGLSQLLPAGGAERGAAPVERVYVVLEGELFVSSGDEEARLGPLDSCFIPAGEEREIANRTKRTTSLLVVMPKREEG
jgi:glyoxylate utilization-related uncharacterized protein